MQHLIIVKYTDLVTDREAFRQEVEALFKPLTDIEGVHEVKLIPGKPLRENRYDLIIAIRMDEDVLGVYDECDIHKKWKRDYAKYVAQKAIFDFDEGKARF